MTVDLRAKFNIIAMICVVALSANLALSAWCIVEYYHALSDVFGRIPSPAAPAGSVVDEVTPAGSVNGLTSQEDVHRRVIGILVVNACCGLVLGIIVVRLLNGWVLRPIAGIRTAAEQIGYANWSHRAAVRSSDELGRLSAQVNRMASMIASMQVELVDHARREAAQRTARCVVHNIRSPLTGIRWLAEAILMRQGTSPSLANRQQRIMSTVDHVLQELQKFRRQPGRESADSATATVSQVIEAALARRARELTRAGVIVTMELDPRTASRKVHPVHFQAMLEVYLNRLIETRRRGERYVITGGCLDEEDGDWTLAFQPGARAARRRGRPPENAPDLAPARLDVIRRAVDLHGGRLMETGDPTRGGRLAMAFPTSEAE